MMFFNQYFVIEYLNFRTLIMVMAISMSFDTLGLNHETIYPKRTKIAFLISNKPENDSTYKVIRKLLLENNQIIGKVINLQDRLSELEEAIRLQEIYESIQTQQAINGSTENLKRSFKKRAYFSLGIGLISSSLLFIGDGNSNKNLRYGGAFLSLSIPIVAIISMKKQINSLVPTTEIDYSMLQNAVYPHNQASRDFFRNYIKAELFALKAGLQSLSKINVESLNQLNSSKDWNYLREVAQNTNKIILDLDNYYVFQIRKFNNLIKNNYIIAPLDRVSNEKLQLITRTIEEELAHLQKQKTTLTSNQKQINHLLEVVNKEQH